MAITLASLVTAARSLVDEGSSDFITSTDGTTYIDEAVDELWRQFMQHCPDDVTANSSTFTTTLAIPVNRGLRFVQKDFGLTTAWNVPQLSVAGAHLATGWWRMGDTIYLSQDLQGSTCTLLYVRVPKTVAGGDTNIDTILEPFREYLVTRTALKIADKCKRDYPELLRRLGELQRELQETLPRNGGMPTRIIDTEAVVRRWWP